MIDAGKYMARATGAEFGESKKKKTPFVRVGFEVSRGPEQGQPVEWTGYLSADTEKRTIDSLRFCGCTFPGNDLFDLEGIDANEVQIVVEHETYTPDPTENNPEPEPKTIAKVAWVNRAAGGLREGEAMDQGARSSLRERMKGRLIAARGGAPAPPKKNGADTQPDPDPNNGFEPGAPPGAAAPDGIPF